MSTHSKLTVVGAGAVGSSVAYAAMIRGAARHIALYDIAPERTSAEVLDLAHGASFVGATEVSGDSDIAVTAGSDVVVITAGAKQQPGQSRLELAATNARILASLIPELQEVSPEAIFVIVSNPCDVLTMLATRDSGLPAERIFASGTTLDTSRLRWEIGRRAGVSPSSVDAMVVGEHGDTGFPLWSTAAIGLAPVLDWTVDGELVFDPQMLDQIAVDVRDAAYTVIRGKGATNYAIGLSSVRIVEAILGDENAVLPVAPVLSGVHGLDDVALSVPCVVNRTGAHPIAQTPLSPRELELLHRSAGSLREAAAALRG